MKVLSTCVAALLLLAGCKKMTTELPSGNPALSTQFIKYTIRQGHQFCDQNTFKAVSTDEMKFSLYF